MTVTLSDAFALPLLCSELGIPMAGMELVHSLGPADAALTQRIGAQRDVFMGNRVVMLAQFDAVDAALESSQLPVPTRPDSYAQYLEWSNGIIKSLSPVATPDTPQGALGGLGRCVGDVLNSLGVRIVVLYLLEVAPAHAKLLAHAEQMAKSLIELVTRLDGMSRFAGLPEPVKPHAANLATMARAAVVVDNGTDGSARLAALRLAFKQLADATRDLRAAIPPA